MTKQKSINGEYMRQWRRDIGGKRASLSLYWLGRCVGYKLRHDGVTVFEGEDFRPSPLHSIDGDETAGALLSFLSLQPGDTDPDYFDSYTPAQLEWARRNGAELSLWSMDLEGER